VTTRACRDDAEDTEAAYHGSKRLRQFQAIKGTSRVTCSEQVRPFVAWCGRIIEKWASGNCRDAFADSQNSLFGVRLSHSRHKIEEIRNQGSCVGQSSWTNPQTRGQLMNATPEVKTVGDLLDLKKANMLYPNPEYQRGAVWTPAQKKRLVDSVLRGYPIPLIYLHHTKRTAAGITNENFEVIDGQQRITALHEYHEGGFKLFDPSADEEEARFPSFIKDTPCPWGRKNFEDLDADLKDRFLRTPLSVVMVETEVVNEARDLFIRLQSGMPLNSQEKRDAWPGQFTEYVLKIGGKPQLAKYPGHDFFNRVLKAKEKNRGEYRQLAAQMVMLFLTRRETRGERLCTINREAIDTFYYKHLTFDGSASDAKRINDVLSLLVQLLGDGKRKKVQGHEAIHLLLLVDTLLDEYTRSWISSFAAAFDQFRAHLARDTKDRLHRQGEYWAHYGQFARTNSDRAEVIQRRHQFFVEKMHHAIKPALKDPTRAFGELEREIIYARDRKQCQVCSAEVLWADAEIHHVEEHSKGGRTLLPNGALVHRHCHPKGPAQTADFAMKWNAKSDANTNSLT